MALFLPCWLFGLRHPSNGTCRLLGRARSWCPLGDLWESSYWWTFPGACAPVSLSLQWVTADLCYPSEVKWSCLVMSDSVWPHRRQPTRPRHPWDSPGKNTGVRCHFLLQCMKVKSESEVAQSCPTLSDPVDCSLPGSSVHGIFQARVLEWIAISFSRGSSWPRNQTWVSRIAGRCFTVWATREATPGDLLKHTGRSGSGSYEVTALPWFPMHVKPCVHPPIMEYLFPSVL